MKRWVRLNDHFVSEIAHATVEGEASAQRRNVHLMFENRRLRKKTFRLAYRYGNAARKLRKLREKSQRRRRRALLDLQDLLYFYTKVLELKADRKRP